MDNSMPVIILGGGSNVLFVENYVGTILLNRITGVIIDEKSDSWCLHVGAGELWHNLVKTCLKNHIPGLENLALIPGYVGSAPIQNIGAYGVELCRFCDYVDVLQLSTNTTYRLSANECQFSYRDSIFKHELRDQHAIIAVGLRFPKSWKPILNYGKLSTLNPKTVTPQQIYNMVCTIRHAKFSGSISKGSAGSFFKNPIVSFLKAKNIIRLYPDAPYYPQAHYDAVKLSAGWLIDRCGLKGYNLGGAAVHDKQALVLVNIDNATGKDIVALARYVRQQVAKQFAVWLEPEVRFIGAYGEIDAVRAIT